MIEITLEYLASQGLSENFPERFWAKVQKTDSCWLWTACTSSDGYGFIGSEGGKSTKTISAHKASWIMHNGPIPKGLHVLHNCPGGDNRGCVNPSHLWLGTSKQNQMDAIQKCRKRNNGPWNAKKITSEIATEIRKLFSQGMNMAELARKFSVSRTHVSKIVHGKSWKVPGAGFQPTPDDYMI